MYKEMNQLHDNAITEFRVARNKIDISVFYMIDSFKPPQHLNSLESITNK
jgi:hypothetical protein